MDEEEGAADESQLASAIMRYATTHNTANEPNAPPKMTGIRIFGSLMLAATFLVYGVLFYLARERRRKLNEATKREASSAIAMSPPVWIRSSRSGSEMGDGFDEEAPPLLECGDAEVVCLLESALPHRHEDSSMNSEKHRVVTGSGTTEAHASVTGERMGDDDGTLDDEGRFVDVLSEVTMSKSAEDFDEEAGNAITKSCDTAPEVHPSVLPRSPKDEDRLQRAAAEDGSVIEAALGDREVAERVVVPDCAVTADDVERADVSLHMELVDAGKEAIAKITAAKSGGKVVPYPSVPPGSPKGEGIMPQRPAKEEGNVVEVAPLDVLKVAERAPSDCLASALQVTSSHMDASLAMDLVDIEAPAETAATNAAEVVPYPSVPPGSLTGEDGLQRAVQEGVQASEAALLGSLGDVVEGVVPDFLTSALDDAVATTACGDVEGRDLSNLVNNPVVSFASQSDQKLQEAIEGLQQAVFEHDGRTIAAGESKHNPVCPKGEPLLASQTPATNPTGEEDAFSDERVVEATELAGSSHDLAGPAADAACKELGNGRTADELVERDEAEPDSPYESAEGQENHAKRRNAESGKLLMVGHRQHMTHRTRTGDCTKRSKSARGLRERDPASRIRRSQLRRTGTSTF